MPRRSYVLTPTARAHLRAAKAWSLDRWGAQLTERYFHDLEKGAQYIAENHGKRQSRDELAGGSGLSVHLVREHYLVYEPLDDRHIAIVSVIRQSRDLPVLLKDGASLIRRELKELKDKIARGEIPVQGPGRKKHL